MLRVVVPSLFLFVACIPTTATEQQLRVRAAFDMQCAEPSLQVVPLDDEVRGVYGCGQRRTYVSVCTMTCKWIENSATGDALPPVASSTPSPPPAASYSPPLVSPPPQ